MLQLPLLKKVSPFGLALGLLLLTTYVIAAGPKPVPLTSIGQEGWEDIEVWNFDNTSDLQAWTLRDKSSADGGEYLWAEDTYTHTTGAQSVWMVGNVLTATESITYPNHLDTWMVYSFTSSVTNVWGTRLVFDWWLDAAPGDTLSWLTSTDGPSFTTVQTESEQLGTWHTDETVPLSPPGYSGDYYIAFRFQSDGDGQSGRGAFVDHLRLQYNRGYRAYLPLIFKRWPPIPYAPYLYEINKQPLDNTYTLTWSIAASDTPVTYTLQESTSADFSNPVNYTSPITSYQVTGKSMGVYHYRVQGNNIWGPGEWSNVRSATVLSRHDEFNTPITGWTVRRTSSPYLNLATATYLGDTLLTGLNDKFDFAIFSPMFQAPAPPYRILMRTRIRHLGNELSYGIVFGGNGGTFCPVDRSNAGSSNGCFSHYYRLNVIWGGYLKYQVKRIDYHDPEKGSGRGRELLSTTNVSDRTSNNGWNTWEIKVYDNGFAVYVNGGLLGWTEDTTYVHEPYYGIFISTYEYNGATFEHDYFYVDPLPATETLPESGYLVPGGIHWYQPLPQTP